MFSFALVYYSSTNITVFILCFMPESFRENGIKSDDTHLQDSIQNIPYGTSINYLILFYYLIAPISVSACDLFAGE